MPDGPDRVFETIWAQAAKVFPLDTFTVGLCGPGPNQITYELVVERGVVQGRRTRDLGEGLSDLVLRTRSPLLVRNFEMEKGSIPLSWMGAPMIAGDRLLGLLAVQCNRQGAFDDRDLSILGILANWAAADAEWVQQHRERQQEAESSAAVLGVVRLLARETEPAGLLRAMAEVVPSLVECGRCSVWSWEPESREFRPGWRATAPYRAESFASAPARAETAPAVSEMLVARDVVIVPAGEERRLGRVEGLRPPEGRSVALVPLAAETEMVGLLTVERARAGEGFAPREVDLLRGLADVAALVIQNQRHHHQASETSALRELNEVKSRLISTISHELRTPLSLIVTGTELLMGRLFEPDQLRQVAELVNQGATRLSEVVDDIIEYADLQSSATSLYLTSNNPEALVREAIEAAAGAGNAGRVLLEVSEPLPAVSMDGGKLKSLVVKLVRNALNFSKESSRVLIRASLESGRLRIDVSDSGFGIPPEDVARVFEPFFRGQASQARCIPGTGLGLAIARRLVEAMSGEIAVRSQDGTGTTVVVSIPVGRGGA